MSVPVLSTHRVSTRASTSTAGSSWTRQRRRARRIAPTANATLVIRTRPSGIIGTTPATLATTAVATGSPRVNCPTTSRPPTGMMIQVRNRSNRLMPW